MNEQLNNVELFLYCVWRLGGSGQYVDIEEVFLEAYRIAPSRFSWRTQEMASDKIGDQALRDAQKRFGKRFILTSKDRNGLQLTAEGVRWVQDRRNQFETLIKAGAPAGHERPSQRPLVALESNSLVRAYAAGEDVETGRAGFADALRLAPDADERAWRERLETYRSAAQRSRREVVLNFFKRLESEHPEWFGSAV